LLFLSAKQVCFVVSCPLIIAYSAFADKRRKGEVQLFWTNSPKTIAPEQFKNAENSCYIYVFELFSRHYITVIFEDFSAYRRSK